MMERSLLVTFLQIKELKSQPTWVDQALPLATMVSKFIIIIQFMSYIEAKTDLEMGNKTSKMHAEEKN